jgi:hypothetical protein
MTGGASGVSSLSAGGRVVVLELAGVRSGVGRSSSASGFGAAALAGAACFASLLSAATDRSTGASAGFKPRNGSRTPRCPRTYPAAEKAAAPRTEVNQTPRIALSILFLPPLGNPEPTYLDSPIHRLRVGLVRSKRTRGTKAHRLDPLGADAELHQT